MQANMTDRRTPGNEEVIAAISETMDAHVDHYHAFNAAELKVMVAEHRELYDDVAPLARDTNEKVSLLVKEIYGTLSPTAADPLNRVGGMVDLLTEMNQTITRFGAQAANGGIPTTRKWTPGQWAFYGAIASGWLTLVGVISVAVLGG
jgi:hypothetical protein